MSGCDSIFANWYNGNAETRKGGARRTFPPGVLRYAWLSEADGGAAPALHWPPDRSASTIPGLCVLENEVENDYQQ